MRQEELILDTENAKVRVIEINNNTISAWHHHSLITDDCFCLVGEIKVHTKNPYKSVILQPGERHTINSGVIHCIENATSNTAKYLLVQGSGKYDFIASN